MMRMSEWPSMLVSFAVSSSIAYIGFSGSAPSTRTRQCPPSTEEHRTMANGNGLLQAALNGDRDHPAAPRTPDELAAEARAAVGAGARSLHLHPYDERGRETLEAGPG